MDREREVERKRERRPQTNTKTWSALPRLKTGSLDFFLLKSSTDRSNQARKKSADATKPARRKLYTRGDNKTHHQPPCPASPLRSSLLLSSPLCVLPASLSLSFSLSHLKSSVSSWTRTTGNSLPGSRELSTRPRKYRFAFCACRRRVGGGANIRSRTRVKLPLL